MFPGHLATVASIPVGCFPYAFTSGTLSLSVLPHSSDVSRELSLLSSPKEGRHTGVESCGHPGLALGQLDGAGIQAGTQ